MKKHFVSRRVLAWITAVILCLSLLPAALANDNSVTEASSWDEVVSAISSATAPITIKLTADVSTPSTAYTYGDESKQATIVGNNHTLSLMSTFQLTAGTLTLKDLTVKNTGTGPLNANGGTLYVDNVSF